MKFEKRQIGETNLWVSMLGMGTASIAGIGQPVAESDARATLDRALEHGIEYFDTAPFYGFGKSERWTGDQIRAKSDDVVISTKTGRLLTPQHGPYTVSHSWRDPLPFVDVIDYTYDAIMRSHEDSLQRLGLNNVDILYVHDIGVLTHGDNNPTFWSQLTEGGGYRAMRELRDNGDISAIGLGVNEWEVLMDAFEIGDWDCFLLAGRYTLLEQTSLSPFLETCVERKSSVIIGGPFNSGILVGGDTWNYDKAPDDIVAKVRIIEDVCKDFDVDMPAAALKFPLTHPAVAATIPGPRTVKELDEIVSWWQQDIPEALWDALANKGLFADGTPLPSGRTVG